MGLTFPLKSSVVQAMPVSCVILIVVMDVVRLVNKVFRRVRIHEVGLPMGFLHVYVTQGVTGIIGHGRISSLSYGTPTILFRRLITISRVIVRALPRIISNDREVPDIKAVQVVMATTIEDGLPVASYMAGSTTVIGKGSVILSPIFISVRAMDDVLDGL